MLGAPNEPDGATTARSAPLMGVRVGADSAPPAAVLSHGEPFFASQPACLVGQLISAMVLIIATAVLDSATEHWGYSMAVGAVAASANVAGLVLLLLLSKGQATERILFATPLLGEMSSSGVLSLFLFSWWGIGVYTLTFFGPFIDTTNGYFALWIGFSLSVIHIGATLPRLTASASPRSFSRNLIGLGVCAIVVGLELSSPSGGLSRQMAYGMVVVVLTFGIVAVMLLLELSDTPMQATLARALHIVVVLLWGLSALWLTFTGPFETPGNGYFALWAGLICASTLVLDVQKRFEAALSDESRAAIWGQLVAATVVIFAVVARDPSATELWGYALSVGIVGAVLAILSALCVENPAGARPLLPPRAGVFDSDFPAPNTVLAASLTPNFLLAGTLFVWWGVGVGVLTIHAPFRTTCNAYFALWIGFGCSLLNIGLSVKRTQACASSIFATHGCLSIAALIVLLSAAPATANDADHRPQSVYALVVACLTILHTALHCASIRRGMGERRPSANGVTSHGWARATPLERLLAIARFVSWTVLAAWCTFTGPFTTTGNGYFAGWIGVLCSVLLLLPLFPQLTSATAAATAPRSHDDGEAEEGVARSTSSPATTTATLPASPAPHPLALQERHPEGVHYTAQPLHARVAAVAPPDEPAVAAIGVAAEASTWE